MRLYTQEDFEALIARLPDTAENQSVYQSLLDMRDENSVERQPYTFEVDFSTGVIAGTANIFPAPTAAGAISSTGNFLVDASAPFMLVCQSYQADLAGAVITVSTRQSPNWVITIQDQSSNRNWMNTPVPIPSIFGQTGSLPFFWPQPRLLPGNTNVQMTVTNYDAAAVDNVRLSFHGYRLYSTRKA